MFVDRSFCRCANLAFNCVMRRQALCEVIGHSSPSPSICRQHSRSRHLGALMKSTLTAAVAVILLCAGASAKAADAKGIWLTADGEAKIRIADCGGRLCGTIAWLKRPLDPNTGKPTLDKQNPDAGKRNRPLIGTAILTGM